MTVRALSLAFIAVWVLLGLYFMLQGVALKLGAISNPGTGFMPFLVGIVLVAFGIMAAIPLLISPQLTESERLPLRRLRDPGIVVVSMIAYSLTLERIGFIASTAILIALLTRFVGGTTFFRAIVLGVLATFFCYVVFGILLGVRLP